MFGSSVRTFIAQAMAQVKATGSITCVTKANLVDGETVTISDGTNTATVFEFDVDGGGVTGGNVQVDVSTDTTAAQVAARLVSAINGVGGTLTVTATDAGSGVITLAADTADTTHNVTITETVANAGFLVSGMSGGTSSTRNGTPTNMEGKRYYGHQAVWTGSVTGTFTFEASDSYDPVTGAGTWKAYTMTTAGANPAGSASDTMSAAIDFPHKWIRPVYTAGNTNAGVLNGWGIAK